MNSLNMAFYAEYIKMRRSRIFWITLGALCIAPVFGAVFVLVLRNPSLAAGNEAIQAKAALTGFSADWVSFFNLIAQAVGVGGMIVFGFIASWVFGREYTDHTIKDLYTLPVNRLTFVFAKLLICIIWSFLVVICVTLVAIIIGFLINLSAWDPALILHSLQKILATAAMVCCLLPPVFFIASVGRGYLAPLGFVVLSVVLAQIVGALGYGAYMPWAVPALYSGLGADPGQSLGMMSYFLILLTGVSGLIATVFWWKFADQTK